MWFISNLPVSETLSQWRFYIAVTLIRFYLTPPADDRRLWNVKDERFR